VPATNAILTSADPSGDDARRAWDHALDQHLVARSWPRLTACGR
jgi:hypothetical protein